MVAEEQVIEEEKITLPTRWESALDQFDQSSVLKTYFGEDYHRAYSIVKRGECNEYHAQISPLDYQWYLRAV